MRFILLFTKIYLILITTDFLVFYYKYIRRKDTEFIEKMCDYRFGHQGKNVMQFGIDHCGLGLSVEYAEGLSESSLPDRFILVSNHQSFLDVPLAYVIFLKHRIRFMSKKELGKGVPGVSNFLKYQNHLLIDRKGNMRQVVQSIKEFAKLAKERGYSIALFPEGTRTKTGELGEFKTAGLKVFLQETDLPVVCVTYFNKIPARELFQVIKTNKTDCALYVSKIIPSPVEKNRETLDKTIEECYNAISTGLEFQKQKFANEIANKTTQ